MSHSPLLQLWWRTVYSSTYAHDLPFVVILVDTDLISSTSYTTKMRYDSITDHIITIKQDAIKQCAYSIGLTVFSRIWKLYIQNQKHIPLETMR